tara:strand:- start:530 stop:682 length:153 start_codon:yes stop_codon:yes gene_type:complete
MSQSIIVTKLWIKELLKLATKANEVETTSVDIAKLIGHASSASSLIQTNK